MGFQHQHQQHPERCREPLFFNVTNSSGGDVALTATLAWNRQQNQTGINNLDLFLYNAANSNLVMCSTSLVDNVEHIFLPKLAQGRYDLQVWKAATSNAVLASEPYALAFDFLPPFCGKDGNERRAHMAGVFGIEATTNLAPANWISLTNPPPQ